MPAQRRHQGKQYNVRVSRRLRLDMDHLGAGPLRIEIVKPMEELRLVLEPSGAASLAVALREGRGRSGVLLSGGNPQPEHLELAARRAALEPDRRRMRSSRP